MRRGTYSFFATTQWPDALDKLAARYADFRKDDLALAVLIALLSRVSKQSTVMVGLQIVRHSGTNTGRVPFSVNVRDDDEFNELLNQVVLKRVATEMRDGGKLANRQPAPDGIDMAVVFGRRMADEPTAEVQIFVGEDGAIEWCHEATIALNGIASMSSQMIALAEEFSNR